MQKTHSSSDIMTAATLTTQPLRTASRPAWLLDLCLAFAICALIYVYYASMGFPTMARPGGDNDSLMRLVEVRDLLGGQGWYDLHQYRVGPEGGFMMHWSRLIDAPLAGIVLAASTLGASMPVAEQIALVLWPLFLMTATLFGLIQLARVLGSEHTIFPAAALGAGALYFVGIYRPASIDHHNAQIALTFAMLAFILKAPGHRYFPALAGLCAALMLAIGMETAPYIAVGGAAVALALLYGGPDDARRAAGFALSFAVATFAAFIINVSPSSWTVPQCDAMSSVQLSLGAFAGFGLAAVALIPAANVTFIRRLVSLGVLGVAFAAVVRFGFPQCLNDPYAAVDARLRDIWLNYIAEAQSVVALAGYDWTKLLTYFVTPVLGLSVLAGLIWRDGASRERLIYAGFLSAAFLVSCWQVRGSSFSVPLATVPLAIGIGMLREQVAARSSLARNVALIAAWVLSFNIVWSATASALSTRGETPGATSISADDCSADASYLRLAEMPKGTILAASDLGSAILVNTAHRVLSAPYHRNIAGNLAMIDAMLGSADQAEGIVRANNVDYVVLCRGNVENRNFSNRAPNGLMANLVAGNVPDWLKKDGGAPDDVLDIYAVSFESMKRE